VRALDRKLLRDLSLMWGQAVTIALVVACGIASFVTMQGTYRSLVAARDHYYEDRRFADVFGHIERAPEPVAARIQAIEGVARVQTRIVRDVLLPMPGMAEPAVGRVVSLPVYGEPALCALRFSKGRAPEPGRSDEVVILEGFAAAHSLEPGDRFPAVLNGMRRDLRVVGVAMSPEFVFAIGRGSFIQDDRRFSILWMSRDAVAPLFRMEGSFDDVLVSLQPGAPPEPVVDRIRRTLEPYGVLQVVARDRQISHRVLSNELQQLESYAIITPVIFLGVAAFLLNVVLARMLHLQRAQIATLKAVGYTDLEIASHYVKLISVIIAAGAVLGLVVGGILGRGMISLYRPFFRFPDLAFRLDTSVAATGIAVSLVAGVSGAMSALLRAVRVPPAEAMRPEAPARYRRPLIERLGLHRIVGVSGRMVLRELFRRPLRTTLSCLGVATATAVVITGYFMYDALDAMVTVQFSLTQREDVEVSFLTPAPPAVVREVANLPGVTQAEAHRVVAVRARVGHRERDAALVAVSERAIPLRAVAQWPPRPFQPPLEGVALSRKLAEVLGVRVGDRVSLEILERDRRVVDVVVGGLVDDVFGLFAYGSRRVVQQIVDDQGDVSGVLLGVDPTKTDALVARLATMPRVAAITRRDETIAMFNRQTGYMWTTTTILTIFGAIIAFGVVYNQARIALSMRSRDLASLRVLGFTRAEISSVLLGELAVYVVVGLPLGFWFGRVLIDWIMSTVDPESYRMPTYTSMATYAFGALVTVLAALVSALVVRRKLDRLDLIGVLKTRE